MYRDDILCDVVIMAPCTLTVCDVIDWLIVYSEPSYLIVCKMGLVVWLCVYGARLFD